jgi:hypothetical protein
MDKIFCLGFCLALLAGAVGRVPWAYGRELLSEKEIEQLRDHQELDKRAELYLKFAALRLDTFKERAKGIESKEGDPLEFHSLADLITGYTKCVNALQDNIDETITYKKYETRKLIQVLRKLKAQAEKFDPQLKEALSYAISKKDEPLYDRVNEALETTKSAIDGAKEGLERLEKLIKKK